MKEVWKDIINYEGLYRVSNLGRIKSLAREVERSDGHPYNQKERIMKHRDDKDGYLIISLCKNRKYASKRLHRLIAIAFIPNPDNKPEINHKDGVKNNNAISNLEWMTRKENTIHAYRNGLIDVCKGSEHQWSLLKDEEVLEIRRLYRTGKYTQKEIGSMFNVHRITVHDIIKYKNWSHLE